MNVNKSKHKMSCNKQSFCEKKKMLKVVGSQINLTPRSDHSACGSYSLKSCKLCSPVPSRTQIEQKLKHTRPKSAECSSVHHPRCNSALLQWSYDLTEKKKSEDSSLTVSHFTDSSSKLLQNLIGTPNSKTPYTEDDIFYFDHKIQPLTDAKLEAPKHKKHLEPEKCHEFSKINSPRIDLEGQLPYLSHSKPEEQLNKNLNASNVRQSFLEVAEEKTVRFLDTRHLPEGIPEKKCSCNIKCAHSSREILYQPSNSELALPPEQIQLCQQKRETPLQQNSPGLQTEKTTENKSIDVKIFQSNSEDGENYIKQSEKDEKKIHRKKRVNPRGENDGEAHRQEIEHSSDIFDDELPVSVVNQLNPTLEELSEENQVLQDLEQLEQSSSNEEILEESRKLELEEGTNDSQKINLSDSTYEEIVHLLQTLEDEDSESLNMKNREESTEDTPVIDVSPEEKVDYLGIVSSYLEEVELHDNSSHENYANTEKWNFEGFSSPRLEELLNKNSVELAHEVFTLKIQVEDQKKGIKLLKETLGEMKEAKKIMELEHQEALQKINSDAEVLVQRHQKFIKQLLNEKNNLNETVSKLVQDLKLGEEKYKRNIKAIEEKHVVEIKRAKEAQAVADKIKREKWMEIKRQKIKEMTVKGLEPELSRMAARQQEEMTELRNLHRAEIEAIELRAARRTSDLMDELRTELTKEKERVVAKETASIRAIMEKEFEEERSRLQQHCQSLKDNIRRQEEKLFSQELEFKQRLVDFKQEEEKKKQKIIRDHEENVEEIRRQHLVELTNLKDSMEAEKEVLLNNYGKQQVAKFFEREAELHKQYKRERDREIEIIIETFENEAAQIQSELTVAGESKLKKLREKMEAELKEVEGSEAALKIKLAETKSKLSEKEDTIAELNSQIRKLHTEMEFFKKSCEEMSSEKAKMKEIIRGEFENNITGLIKEKENLEKDMAVCKELHVKELAKKDQLNVQIKHEMQKELTRVYSRIKTAVNKKEKIIESLRQENGAISQRCRQLELMLDHQRRNLLLQ